MRILIALFLSSPVLAQAISAGLRAGIPVTSVLSTDELRQAATERWLVGPAVEWHWRHGIAFGAEFMVRRTSLGAYPVAGRQVAVWSWELPGTMMYQFRTRAKPLLRAGVSVNRCKGVRARTIRRAVLLCGRHSSC
jgi:hypothetical protein